MARLRRRESARARALGAAQEGREQLALLSAQQLEQFVARHIVGEAMILKPLHQLVELDPALQALFRRIPAFGVKAMQGRATDAISEKLEDGAAVIVKTGLDAFSGADADSARDKVAGVLVHLPAGPALLGKSGFLHLAQAAEKLRIEGRGLIRGRGGGGRMWLVLGHFESVSEISALQKCR